MASPVEQNPLAVIFLDMEGVLINHASPRNSEILAQRVSDLVKSYPFYSNPQLSKLMELRAKASCLNHRALKNLRVLIDNLSESMQVAIVITSHWREGVSAFELKEHVFKDHFFHHYIIDKIPDRDVTYIRQKHFHPEKPLQKTPSKECSEKYGFDLTHQKGRMIEYWLRENCELRNIHSAVIIDANTNPLQSELKTRFPHQLVQINSENLFTIDNAHRCFDILNSPFSHNFAHEDEVKRKIDEAQNQRFRNLAKKIKREPSPWNSDDDQRFMTDEVINYVKFQTPNRSDQE